MKEYHLNERLRKQLVKVKIKEASSSCRLLDKIYRTFVFVCVIVYLILLTGMITVLLSNLDQDVLTIVFLIGASIFLAPIPSLILSIIPIIVKNIRNKKYLWPWTVNKNETVWIADTYIEQGRYSSYYGEGYITLKMNFEDVVRMEKDSRLGLIRVYGPVYKRIWSGEDRAHCMEKIKPQPKGSDVTYITIAEYFDNYDELVQEIIEKSEKQLIERERPI